MTAYAHLTDDAQATLATWVAPNAEQERLRTEYAAHLLAHPDAVVREGPPAHLTVGCLVLDGPRERVLLTHHARAHRWFQFGGHLEPGDAGLREAAEREGREESGIDDLVITGDVVHLDRHALPAAFGRCREHLDVRYAAVAPRGATPRVSAESIAVRWWPVDALPESSRDDLTPLVTAAVRALGGAGR